MTIKMVCNCRRALNLLDGLAGKHIRCPSCQAIIQVPNPPKTRVEPAKPVQLANPVTPKKPKSEKQRPVRKKPIAPAVSEWDESYNEYDSEGDYYPNVPSNQRGVGQRTDTNGRSDVERILRMLFCWPIILGMTLTTAGMLIWIFLPELQSLVPELPVDESPSVISVPNEVSRPIESSGTNEASNQMESPRTNETRIGETCFVTFPEEPQPIVRVVSSPFGPASVTGSLCEVADSKNVLLALCSTYDQKRFANSEYTPQKILELAAEAAMKPRAGYVVQQKSITQVNVDDWMLELTFSYPAGILNGNRYPAETTRFQAHVKQNRMFTFTVGSEAPVSAAAEAQKEAFFNSIRFSDAPGERNAASVPQEQHKPLSSPDPYQSFLHDTLMERPQVPAFPALGQPYHRFDSGETVYFVSCGNGPSVKGQAMNMRVYLPAGASTPGTRKCILIAPAGTNLITGNDVDAGDYHAEAFPYAKAGMVVVLYSLDGSYDRPGTDRKLKQAYTSFSTAGGGVLNGQLAYEFVVQRLPIVDTDKVFSAGHSSAGTVSLLLASLEPRLAGCIAYAPICNVEDRLADALSESDVEQLFPRLRVFTQATSPQSQISSYGCPVFVFHAMDDSNEPFSRTAKFVNLMKAANKDITFIQASRGDHYQSMIDEGIPAAIEWLREH